MRVALFLGLVLLGMAAARAAEFSPAPYYSSNPYDDLVIGPGFVLRGQGTRMEFRVGYSVAQQDGRGRLAYQSDEGLGANTGYRLQIFHEVQSRPTLIPVSQTGFHEGRTGAVVSLFRRLGASELVTLSLVGDKVWVLPARGTLRGTGSDRIHSLQLAYQQNTRDDLLNPRSGGRVLVTASQAARIFGGTRSYAFAAATWVRYQELGASGVFAWRLHAAGTRGALPVQRQLRLPGEGVRGYDVAAGNGNMALVANAEMRLPLVRESIGMGPLGHLQCLQLAVFADLGTVRESQASWIVCSGLGLGIRAPATAFGQMPLVLRLDVAQGLTRGGQTTGYLLLAMPELF